MKTKIQIYSIFGKLLFEHECEDNTIAKTVGEAKKTRADLSEANLSRSNLSGANLSWVDLSWADLSRSNLSRSNLSGANLSWVDLSWVDLSRSNLSGANLSGANLSGANLSGANIDKRYIQVACIGSSKRMTTYCFDDDVIWCGCFKGSLSEFELKVNESHANNNQYLKEYLGFINYVKSLK
jgi:hypothetical protein